MVLLILPVLVRMLMHYILIIPGAFGFEWTERYGSIALCNGDEYLLTRMRHVGSSKYVPVLRRSKRAHSYILWNHTSVAYNPTLVCLKNTLHIIGSPNSELHFTATGILNSVSVYMMPLNATSSKSHLLALPIESCIERYFNTCKLDSRFSVAEMNGTQHLYIRANMNPLGGSRHVQHSQSHDGGLTWTRFEEIHIHNYTVHRDNNIYIFDVFADDNGYFVARYPAVIGKDGGIYESVSDDGLNWSQPKLIRKTESYGERTTLHPVGHKYAMQINLLFRTKEVEMFELIDGELYHNSNFDTQIMHSSSMISVSRRSTDAPNERRGTRVPLVANRMLHDVRRGMRREGWLHPSTVGRWNR